MSTATSKPGVWCTEPDGYLEPKIGPDGTEAGRPAKTVIEVFESTAEKYATENALAQKIDGEWKFWTWKDYYDESMGFAQSLLALNVPVFGITNILFGPNLSPNSL